MFIKTPYLKESREEYDKKPLESWEIQWVNMEFIPAKNFPNPRVHIE